MYRLAVVVSVMVAVAVVAEVIEFPKCDNSDGLPEHCTVNEVRISPCTSKKVCRMRKGTHGTISFDFTPDFTAQKLKTAVIWVSSLGEVPWMDLNTDGCASTTCPSEAGKTQTFNYSLGLGKKFPDGRFNMKWKVFDEADESKLCCFKFVIQIRK